MIEPGGVVTLLDRCLSYVRKHGMAPSRFGILAIGSPTLLWRLRDGKKLRPATIERVEALLSSKPAVVTRRRIITRRYQEAARANAEIERLAREFRRTDPLEQAKLFLQQRGYVVVSASVFSPGREGYLVGQRQMSKDEVLDRARARGWRG